jgi:hypothetical protein
MNKTADQIEWTDLYDQLLGIENIAMDLLAQFPDAKAEIVQQLRGTADAIENGELDEEAEEQAKMYGYRSDQKAGGPK